MPSLLCRVIGCPELQPSVNYLHPFNRSRRNARRGAELIICLFLFSSLSQEPQNSRPDGQPFWQNNALCRGRCSRGSRASAGVMESTQEDQCMPIYDPAAAVICTASNSSCLFANPQLVADMLCNATICNAIEEGFVLRSKVAG